MHMDKKGESMSKKLKKEIRIIRIMCRISFVCARVCITAFFKIKTHCIQIQSFLHTDGMFMEMLICRTHSSHKSFNQ